VGAVEAGLLGLVEATVKYHPGELECLTPLKGGQRLAGSLTGAVASQIVTEAPKGSLSAVGNRA
jgi:hypothetical protein